MKPCRRAPRSCQRSLHFFSLGLTAFSMSPGSGASTSTQSLYAFLTRGQQTSAVRGDLAASDIVPPSGRSGAGQYTPWLIAWPVDSRKSATISQFPLPPVFQTISETTAGLPSSWPDAIARMSANGIEGEAYLPSLKGTIRSGGSARLGRHAFEFLTWRTVKLAPSGCKPGVATVTAMAAIMARITVSEVMSLNESRPCILAKPEDRRPSNPESRIPAGSIEIMRID